MKGCVSARRGSVLLTTVVAILTGAPEVLSAQGTRPVAPFQVADHVYFVGNSSVGVFLITGTEGHVLLDTGYASMVPQVTSSIEALGFDASDVRILLNSHAHLDHAGGHATFKARTGAQVLAHVRDVASLESGGREDPVLGGGTSFPPVRVDRVIEDGETVRLGEIEMVANLTPGHTPGCTSWSTRVRVEGEDRTAVFICSLSILGGVRLSGPDATYSGIEEDFRRSYAVLRELDCEVFLASHSGFFDLGSKLARLRTDPGTNPFLDPEGCSTYVDRAEARFMERLASETGTR